MNAAAIFSSKDTDRLSKLIKSRHFSTTLPWLIVLITFQRCSTFQFHVPTRSKSSFSFNPAFQFQGRFHWPLCSDWSGFGALDDDDISIDTTEYAREDDSDEKKAQVGSQVAAPIVTINAEPIFVPPGSRLPLDVTTILGVLSACRADIATVFGYTAENRGVGITGGIDFVDLDGPIVCISLKGRFWHEESTVVQRVKAYLIARIPEIVDVVRVDE